MSTLIQGPDALISQMEGTLSSASQPTGIKLRFKKGSKFPNLKATHPNLTIPLTKRRAEEDPTSDSQEQARKRPKLKAHPVDNTAIFTIPPPSPPSDPDCLVATTLPSLRTLTAQHRADVEKIARLEGQVAAMAAQAAQCEVRMAEIERAAGDTICFWVDMHAGEWARALRLEGEVKELREGMGI